MAWPTKVARNAPTMPSTVVKMKPLGLFGPGESSRAMMPATKPTTMIQMMPPIIVLPKNPDQKSGQKPVRKFNFRRHPPIGGQMMDDLRHLLAQSVQQVDPRQSG